jgi:hypothetical protein
MRVRVLKDHSSPIGPHRAKHKGDEFITNASDAAAHIAAGNLAEIKTRPKAKTPSADG